MKFSHRLAITAFVICGLAVLYVFPAAAQVLAAASLNVERRGHTSAALQDGRVLIVGGENTGGVVNQAEIFDATSQTFLIVGASSARTDHTATLLADGRVLITGGRDNVSALASTEIFDPADNSFSAGPPLNRARAGHTATTLADGRILLVGGDAAGSAEILDVDHQLATLVASLAEPRTLHGAALLRDGRVLIVGGIDPASSAQILDSAEIFNPQTGQFSAALTTMGIARALPTVKVLPDGKVQIIGGGDFSMEMFNPATTAFNALAHLPPTQDLLAATLGTESRAALISTAIANNTVLQPALQDPDIAELLDRSDYTITDIPQADQALVAGGVNSQGEVLTSSVLVASSQATVTTDQFDYPPGKTVTITGSGFQPGELVSMVLHEEPETHPDTTVTSAADGSGNFTNTDFAPATGDVGRAFTLTAVGQQSSKAAQTAFSDANATASIKITKVNGCTIDPGPCGPFSNPIHIEGTASSLNFQGQLSQYQVQIDWGDGIVVDTSSVSFTGNTGTGCVPATGAGCANFSGTWSSSPDHVYASGGSRTLTARLYHTQAPGNDSAADSFSIATIIVVAPPTVTTAIHDASHNVITTAAAGTTVHDSVTVSGSNGTPTGTVTFDFFNNNTCAGTPSATSGTFTLTSAAADATSFAQGPLTAGNYSFKAHYNGDSNYTAGDSACEPLTVNKTTATVTTAIHNGSNHTTDVQGTTIALDSTIHDKATVTGNGAIAVTGSVTFKFFLNNNCSGTPSDTSSTQALTSGTVDATGFAKGPLGAGSYSFLASYSGDGSYNPADASCETVTVGKASVSVTTAIHNGSNHTTDVQNTTIALDSTIHDKATVTGDGTTTPTGSVTFKFFLNNNCSGTPSDTSSTQALTSGTVDATGFAKGPLGAGSYSFLASYSGDANYNAADAGCETVTVGKATPTVTTAIHNGSNHTTDVQGTTIALDSTIHDKATVTGDGTTTPTGSVTLKFFTNNNCSGTPSDTSSTQALTSGTVDATGFAKGPLGAGSYSFLASYNGDANYNAADASCETVTVGKATPTGSVTFKFFLNNNCSGTPSDTSGTQALTSGTVDATGFAKGPLAAGSYSFLASYSGDANYNARDASCETVTVGKASVSVTTAIHNGSNHTTDVQNTTIALDSTIHDRATVTGDGTTTPTGSVTFKFFLNNNCSGTPSDTSGTQALTSGTVDATGFAKGPLAAGSYSFLASYSGDTNYNAADASCETVTVGKATVTVTTAIHNGSNHTTDVQNTTIALDSTIHDKATVTGDGTTTPTGSITFKFFLNNNCSGTPSDTSGTQALTSGTVDATGFAKGPLAAGSYSFLASYSGDGNYNAADAGCETVTVGKATVSVTTAIHNDSNHTTDVQNTTIALDSTIHDKATVTGDGTITPTGSVTLKFFLNNNCSGTPSDTSSTQALTSGTVDATGFAKGPLGAGSYSFLASYSGDANYNAADASCETVAIGKATPSLTTVIHSGNPATDVADSGITSIAGGGTVHDKATITGDGTTTPTGTVTFTFYRNGDCTSGTPELAGTVSLVNGVAHPSDSKGPLNPGSYAFKAHYNGDGNYNAVDAACEPLSVSKIDPTAVTTAIHNASSHTNGISFALSGTSVHDSATVTGALATPTGTVTFKWFTNGTCTGTAAATSGTFALTSGTVDATTFAQIPDIHTSTTYGFQATYNGDAVYNAKTGACETLTILIQETSMTTSLSGGGQTGTSITVQAGFAVTDTATLTSATSNAGGTVTYTVFSDNTCTTVFANAGTKTVTNGVVPASNPITFTNAQTGVYYWKADYSGDISNAATTSGCSEQVTVTQHTITLAFTGGGFVPKITTPLPKAYKSPGVEVDLSFTDILHDGVRVDINATARNIANNCLKPLSPSADSIKVFSVPVSQGNLDTVQLAFKLYEVTKGAMSVAKKAKCQSLTLEIAVFSAVGVDSSGGLSNTLSLLGEGPLDINIPLPTKKAPSTLTLSPLTSDTLLAPTSETPAGTRLPAPQRQ